MPQAFHWEDQIEFLKASHCNPKDSKSRTSILHDVEETEQHSVVILLHRTLRTLLLSMNETDLSEKVVTCF